MRSNTTRQTGKQTSEKPIKKSKEEVAREKARAEWWSKATQFAENAHYGATCYIPALSEEQIWGKHENWIYDRFTRLGKAVQTGITTEQLIKSVSTCQYIPHRERTGLDHLPEIWLRPGTREYIHVVKRLGMSEVRAWQQAFLAGFDDLSGNHWCGLCSFRQRFMDAGFFLDYPDASTLYTSCETCGVAGYEQWLALAQGVRHLVIETIVVSVERKLHA